VNGSKSAGAAPGADSNGSKGAAQHVAATPSPPPPENPRPVTRGGRRAPSNALLSGTAGGRGRLTPKTPPRALLAGAPPPLPLVLSGHAASLPPY
jgi:hypothetical protein